MPNALFPQLELPEILRDEKGLTESERQKRQLPRIAFKKFTSSCIDADRVNAVDQLCGMATSKAWRNSGLDFIVAELMASISAHPCPGDAVRVAANRVFRIITDEMKAGIEDGFASMKSGSPRAFSIDAVQQKIITLIGKPGAGKGTQGKLLHEQTGFPHLSTGDMLRTRAEIPDELGWECKEIVTNGTYAADDLMVQMISERIADPDCAKGFILDGFPRTMPQVMAFEAMLAENGKSITHAIVLEVSDATALMRMKGRRICKKCGAIYHIPLNPPRDMVICDGHDEEPTKLTTRPDDADPQKRQNRLALHYNETEPVIDLYKEQKGIVAIIDGECDSPAIVYERIVQKTSLAKVRRVAHQ